MMHSVPPQVRTAILDFLSDQSQWDISLSGSGAVYRLEKMFAALVGLPYALAVSNATLGLWAAFSAFDVRDADVITTPYTWGGSLSGLLQTGNRPIFADIDKDTLTLDPEQAVRAITPRTKAILAVDIYGHPCNGPALRKIADQHGLILIQDCAQSFGAYFGKQHTGWWADAAVFSFTLGKPLFAGEGGIIATRDQEVFRRLVRETQHPLRQLRDVPDIQPPNEMAVNLRINPLTAIWAEAAFQTELDRVNEHRRENAEILRLLNSNDISESKTPDLRRVKPSFSVLTFEPRCQVSEVMRVLSRKKLNYQLSLPPIIDPLYRHEHYLKIAHSNNWIETGACPVAEEQCRRRLRLVKTSSNLLKPIPFSKSRSVSVNTLRSAKLA